MSIYSFYADWGNGLSGAGLEGVIGQVALGPGNRVGFADSYGNFYYFNSPSLEARYGQHIGEQLNVAESALSRTDPRVPVPGQLPWTLPGVGAPSSSNHKWAKIDLYAGIGLASLLFGPSIMKGLFGSKQTGQGNSGKTVYSPPSNGGSNVIEV